MNCPQPIPVRLGSERVQLICAACDYRTARQVFKNEHGSPT